MPRRSRGKKAAVTLRLAIALLTLGSLAPAAPAQTGWTPPSFRHDDGARDLREGPGPDRWTIAAVDPRSHRTLVVFAGAGESTLDVHMNPLSDGGWTVERRSVAMAGPGFRRVAFPGPNQNAGEMVLRRVRGGWRLTGRAERVYEIDLTIRSRGPGPTMVARHPEAWGLLRRAMPVMDGTATGRLRQGEPMRETERIRGWRTTIVHDWWVPSSGCCPADPAAPVWPYPRCCADHDVAVAYGAGGATAVIGGWTKTAPNDDKGGWSGVIARRAGGRLSWCRARRTRIVHQMGLNRTLVPESMRVRGCGPRLRFRAIHGIPERFQAFVGGRRTGTALWLHREADTTGPSE